VNRSIPVPSRVENLQLLRVNSKVFSALLIYVEELAGVVQVFEESASIAPVLNWEP
jgi:hypothetical protein